MSLDDLRTPYRQAIYKLTEQGIGADPHEAQKILKLMTLQVLAMDGVAAENDDASSDPVVVEPMEARAEAINFVLGQN